MMKFLETLKKNVKIYCVASGKSLMVSVPYFLLWRKRMPTITVWSGYLADEWINTQKALRAWNRVRAI